MSISFPRLRGGTALVGLLLCAACGHESPLLGRDPRPASVLAPSRDVDPYYAAPGPLPRPQVLSRIVGPSYERWRLRLPARHGPDAAPEAREALEMIWWRPRHWHDPRPAVLLSPILGSRTAFMDDFASHFVAQGWHAVLVTRPEIEYDEARPLVQVEERLRTAVSRQVQALDWLVEQPEVDASRLATFGISAGGIQGVLVAGADPRYVAHVVALAGGPLADVFVDSDERHLVKLARRARAQERAAPETMRERLRAVIRTDPVALAPRVPREQVLLVLARRDTTVPFATGCRLREALGRPATVFLPFDHYGSVLSLPGVRNRVIGFFRARFDAVGAGPDR